ncbi:hypothetical protein WN943_008095 [Citrus x changshan-huyou]
MAYIYLFIYFIFNIIACDRSAAILCLNFVQWFYYYIMHDATLERILSHCLEFCLYIYICIYIYSYIHTLNEDSRIR